jgi:hypothetical protein
MDVAMRKRHLMVRIAATENNDTHQVLPHGGALMTERKS